MDLNIYVGRIGKHLEGEFFRKYGIEKIWFKSAENLLAELKREFGKSENKSAKVAKLKKVETKLEL